MQDWTFTLVRAAWIVLCLSIGSRALAVDLVGYLPYYRMNGTYNSGTLPDQLAMIDEIRYFGLTAASNGSIVPLDGGSMVAHTARIDIIKNAIAALPAESRPRLAITLGGAGEAANFNTISASSSLSTTFAQNIEDFLDTTGATAVDIDWEHPQGATQFNNYGTMLQRIKEEVGAERRVYATIDPTIRVPTSVFDGPNGIDGISLMTYELAWWANDPSDLNRGEHSLPLYVEHSTKFWTDAPGSPNLRPWVFANPWGLNAPEENLGVGLPFFGRIIGTSQAPQGGQAFTYSELANGWSTTDGNYYTSGGQTAWITGPDLVAERVEYAHEQGLDHIIIWEIGQDLHPTHEDSLLRAAYEKKLSLESVVGDYDGDRDVDTDDFLAWQKSFGMLGEWGADGNGDLVVDAADYVIWRKHLPPEGGSGAVTVPEPRAASLFAVGILSLILLRTRAGVARSAAND